MTSSLSSSAIRLFMSSMVDAEDGIDGGGEGVGEAAISCSAAAGRVDEGFVFLGYIIEV